MDERNRSLRPIASVAFWNLAGVIDAVGQATAGTLRITSRELRPTSRRRRETATERHEREEPEWYVRAGLSKKRR